MMKRTLIFMSILVMSVCTRAAINTIKVELMDGTTASVMLSNTLVISFEDDQMKISDDRQNTSFALDDVKSYHYAEDNTQSIYSVKAESDFVIDHNSLKVTNPDINEIFVYDMAGMLIAKMQLSPDHTADLMHLRNGIYMLCIGQHSLKIKVSK